MPIVESEFASSRDPRLATQLADRATSAAPAWLWSTDGSRILWANAVGAAIFGAANANECAARRFDARHPVAAEIVRLAATLPSTGQARLERLRGFGASFGRTLTCVCSRFALANGSAAVLIIANEPAGPQLTLRERVNRLFTDQTRPLAVFAPDGTFLAATAAAQSRLAGSPTLSALGFENIAAQARAGGRADGMTTLGSVTVQRLGSNASAVLVVIFPPHLESARAAANASADVEVAPASSAGSEAPALPSENIELAPTPSAGTAAASRSPEIEAAPVAPQIRVESPTPSPPQGPAVAAAALQAARSVRSAPDNAPIAERRHPLRFVWQMDADGHFVVGSDEFIELMGPQTTAAFGRLWSEIAADLKLDPEHQVARALATRETWSGVSVSWPVNGGAERLPVELSGLPVFDRERNFRGYRGFGVCRDVARINQLAHARRERPIGFMAGPEAAEGAAATAPAQRAAVADTKAAAAMPPSADAARDVADTKAAAAAPPGAEAASKAASRDEHPAPSVAPNAANVVPFRPGTSEPKTPSLTPVERKAFRDLAQELTARLRVGSEAPIAEGGEEEAHMAAAAQPAQPSSAAAPTPAAGGAPAGSQAEWAEDAQQEARPAFELGLLDQIPVGVLIYQEDSLLYANRHFLELSGYESLDTLMASGGLNALVAEPGAGVFALGSAQLLSLKTGAGGRREVEGGVFAVPWGKASALALIVTNGEAAERRRTTALSLSAAESEIRELAAKLEAARKSEEELRSATREAQKAAAAKADFLGKVSHEIRTPLNAITGFTEVIMAERFGPIGNDRYREYLKDVHTAGMHIVALLNDLLDLSKIESGQLGLNFANVSLNELTRQCVGIMQPQASRARIIIRTALAPGLPEVVADERSLRQIVLNLLSNSIKFTGPGGQVIVSTAFADSGEAVLRVRDTGVGMSEQDVEAALEPFRQTAIAGSWGSGGTGLGLPLTKALAEANRAHFSITSAPNAGTLIEVAFPPARVVAQ
jgi:signal transduction histidine kinase/PAS domain-containing protein